MSRRILMLVTLLALTAMLPLGALAADSMQCARSYTIQAGDNLFRIALNNGLSTEELAAQNGIANPAAIWVGQVITIDTCAMGTGGPALSTGAATSYTVQPGDNLFRIALRFGMTTERLAAYNGISNQALIYVGQSLAVPGETGSTGGYVAPSVVSSAPGSLGAYENAVAAISFQGQGACGVFSMAEWGYRTILPSDFPGCNVTSADQLTVACYDPSRVLAAGGSAGWRSDVIGDRRVVTDQVTGVTRIEVRVDMTNATCGVFRR